MTLETATSNAGSLPALLAAHHGLRAIGAPGEAWLDGAGLQILAGTTATGLNAHGIGRGDRVALVLPNGPCAATAFLAVASCASAAPLNPAYKASEFEFYLGDLQPRAIIISEAEAGPVLDVAASLAIKLIILRPVNGGSAGQFILDFSAIAPAQARSPGLAQASDEALVLHTSGTTARPKIVPLSQANLAASARHIATSLALGPDDICLNVMPLFHIHGLVAACLASLAGQGSVSCTPGFNAFKFFGWLDQVKPSWYTAVPTMHQAILLRARDDAPAPVGLRFIRSSSASLPPQVMAALEQKFACPVIEAYGMTEAAHQMASNRLPPGARKPGSVGVAAGPEIAIRGADGFVGVGQTGEVVIRGPNVTAGYANNPTANDGAFIDGWFRTGDEGMLDADGYLFLTGRLKEMINRGGEKISPLEIDVSLLDHPAVAEACCFAIAHPVLGEEVAAVVVLREGMAASPLDLREFLAGKLAPFKVPRQIVISAAIPKGATGKVQRIGMAQRLGMEA
ncbi:MAG TPA: acyl--CoA ligase [Acidiphilium sp.]|nr:MAG: AMP-dependent synthetase [Acidiphilium sp. 21-60-14]OZB39839.1 MAG: AMP-dependent synthetase [Acidiphilium sp. 34-60-192]HQT87116.1 acyl--CoA ligase [Acidiphilium sp.]HQU24482.1 acyl--CoA ligase [Acidiphilium sp.]